MREKNNTNLEQMRELIERLTEADIAYYKNDAPNMSKRSKKHGELPSGENVAPQDFRGRDGHVKDTRRVKAPDGISGDWGK